MLAVCARSLLVNPILRPVCISRQVVYTSVQRFRVKMAQSSASKENTEPKHHGNRKFYDISRSDDQEKYPTFKTKRKPDSSKLIKYVGENVIGKDLTFVGPYGQRKVVYCDYTASGRSLKFIEDYIQNEVLPAYGNTHTTTTVTSLQTTLFRHEARDIIRNAVNASEHDSVVFTGSGSTASVHKLIHALHLEQPPVVFVGPYEHHSNLLPWREVGGQVVRIAETEDGLVDLLHLERELQVFQSQKKHLIGCFSAASNITGTLVDDVAITALLHRYGALAFWDYATAAPYVTINMNPVVPGPDEGFAYKDAIFISPHKFVGGVGSPGVLVAKKKLFRNPVPSVSGGGSVFFVSREGHRYLQEIEMREEGGTPAIVESIRAGLVFQLKENISSEAIMAKEEEMCRQAIAAWQDLPSLVLLGNLTAPRLPIFSFLVRHVQSGLFLHHNYVCALLNDVFGIQSRGGCACAGPYAQDVLGINEELAVKYEELLLEDSRLDRTHLRRYNEYSSTEMLRPGVVRLNLAFFMNPEELFFVLEAVKMVANHGWKLLPQYVLSPETGEWRHITNQVFKDRKWLGSVSYASGVFTSHQPVLQNAPPEPADFTACLAEAQKIFDKAEQAAVRQHVPDQRTMFNESAAPLRWFLLPSEAKSHLVSKKVPSSHQLPFHPKRYFSDSEKQHVVNAESSSTANGDCSKSSDSENGGRTYGDQLSIEDAGVGKCVGPNYSQSKSKDKISNTIEDQNTCNMSLGDTTKCTTCIPRRFCGPSRKTLNEPTKGGVTGKWHHPPKYLMKPTIQAITDFNMISEGDRILVCLSGGKDSLALLHTLHQYQYFARSRGVNFTLGAVTVDPQSEAYDPSSLISYTASLDLPYFYEEQAILEHASSLTDLESICSFCSRMKRGRIYACARREGYNVLAFGQHLDDLAETFLMSAFHNGGLRTMKAHYTIQEGDLRVIRPFAYVREKNTRQFAEQNKLPVIAENCPACFEAPKERHRTKQMLAQQEVLFPRLFCSLRSALRPLMAINKCGIESNVLIMNGLRTKDEE